MENPEQKSTSGAGAVIGIIIIILVLLAGAWYFLAERVIAPGEQAPIVEESQMSTSTETSDIEADLGKININALDQE